MSIDLDGLTDPASRDLAETDLTETDPADRPADRPGDRGGRGRRPLALVALVLCVAAAAGAGAVRAAVQPPPAPPAPRVLATVELRRVVLAPLPTAVLEVTIENRDQLTLRATAVESFGAGIRRTVTTPVERDLDPGESLRVRAEVPIDCGQLVRDVGPPSVRVGVSASDGVTWFTTALLTGPAVTVGMCPTAVDELPEGWPIRAVLRGFTATGGVATVSIGGLPAGADRVLYLRADDWTPATGDTAVDADGVATLTMVQPDVDCTPAAGPATLPAGLQVMVTGPVTGPQLVYLAVGPELSRWLLDAVVAACGPLGATGGAP